MTTKNTTNFTNSPEIQALLDHKKLFGQTEPECERDEAREVGKTARGELKSNYDRLFWGHATCLSSIFLDVITDNPNPRQGNITTATAEAERYKAERARLLRRSLDSVSTIFRNLTKDNAELQGQLTTLPADKVDLKTDNVRLQSSLAFVEDRLSAAENNIDSLAADNARLRALLSAAEDNNKLTADKSNLQSRLDISSAKNFELTRDNAACLVLNKGLKEKLFEYATKEKKEEQTVANLKSLASDMSDLQKRCDKTEAMNEEFIHQTKKLNEEVQKPADEEKQRAQE